MESFLFFAGVIELGLLGLPIAAYTIAKRQLLSRRQIIWLCSFVAAIGLGRMYEFSFRGDALDMILPVGLYLAYCVLVFNLRYVQHKIIRNVTFVVGCIPIVVGYISATTAALGVLMIGAELGATRTIDLQESFYYREYSYGNAISDDDGTIIELYTSPSWFPIIEKRLITKRVSSLKYNTDSLRVALDVREDSYDLQIRSNDGLQFDTLIAR
ncbi:MAG: hypothetical protein JSS89_03580 [Bacteroidetes bacterium]|nr:hypothetical protein [Bacteroidota bacterium]